MRSKTSGQQFRRFFNGFLLIAFLAVAPRPVFAQVCQLLPPDVALVTEAIEAAHSKAENTMMKNMSEEFTEHRDWLVNTFFKDQVLPALMLFTEQMSAVAMHQVFIIGTFLDAKHQLETQRLFQELQAQAHKDYQPSEDFCWFGTAARSLAASEQIGKFNAVALSQRQMKRHLGNSKNMQSSVSSDEDKIGRWQIFKTEFCDPKDNNLRQDAKGSIVALTGLQTVCPSPGKNVNADIDFTRIIDEPRTLDVGFNVAPGGANQPTTDEKAVIALGNNLYGHDVLSRGLNPTSLINAQYQHLYFALRSVAAKRSVAENSYNAIVGMKTSGGSDMTGTPNTSAFLGALLNELGVTDDNKSGSNQDEIFMLIGEEPSYYAQLEILAKKIYQNPDFYANLYDTPANVQRKSVALKAIELMLDRAIFESQLRQEMSMSVLLSAKMRDQFKAVNEDLGGRTE